MELISNKYSNLSLALLHVCISLSGIKQHIRNRMACATALPSIQY